MQISLSQILLTAAQQNTDGDATRFSGRKKTYGELTKRVARLAGGLRSIGITKGDRVGILALNSDRYLEVYFAAWWLGAVVNPVNTRWSLDEVAFSIEDSGTRLLFVDDEFEQTGIELRKRCNSLSNLVHLGARSTGMVDFEELLEGAQPIEDEPVDPDSLAGVFYTGGTTGRPKGVMLSHSALMLNTVLSLLAAPVPSTARLLQATPLFHLAGLAQTLRFMMVGASISIQPSFIPSKVLAAIEQQRITHLATVPTMLQLLVDAAAQAPANVSSVSWVVYGASPITQGLLEGAMRLFPNADFVQGYGMTEMAAAVTYLGSEHHSNKGRKAGKLASAGTALPGIGLKIVDPAGGTLGENDVGEILVRSPCAMLGYWNRPAETAEALRNGWFHTGDLGRIDGQGFLFVVDRLKDMIITGGENVYSGEVERAICQHPGVDAAAVFGVPDSRWGESVHAVIVLKPGASVDAQAIQDHCRTLIARYKCPRGVDFVEALPVSGAGKILKFQLREAYLGNRDRQ